MFSFSKPEGRKEKPAKRARERLSARGKAGRYVLFHGSARSDQEQGDRTNGQANAIADRQGGSGKKKAERVAEVSSVRSGDKTRKNK